MYFGFEDIHINYGDKPVLRGLTTEFARGEITALVGPNGCGKSSLLRILTRGVKQQRGLARFDGQDTRRFPRKELARKIAVLPQVHSAPSDITVRALVTYGRFPHLRAGQRPGAEDLRIAEQAMADTHVSHLADRALTELSGGERQRAWIAMTVCQQPEVLVLDEPTTFLDVGHQVDVLELVRRLNRERGMTVVMVLHDLNLAARYAHSLCAIKDGVVYRSGPPGDVVTTGFLRDVFGIDAHIYTDEVNTCPYFIPQNVI